ncbi:alpha-2-macroglobulin [Paraferrimonas sp. SM1919]|uniref:alpha-2-macroglobulin family protein n=1 Tax=Paraferrimonas sp. SM1919 TaxID=2662263 RepID=UPI0013D8426A|nr:MG2 domain-containing protein [Paraferrimonas sp. SM1919]
MNKKIINIFKVCICYMSLSLSLYANAKNNNLAQYNANESELEISLTSVAPIENGPVLTKKMGYLPISYKNVTEVELELLWLNKPGKVISQRDWSTQGGKLSEYQIERVINDLQSVWLERFKLENPKQNIEHSARLALPSNIKDGWYIARIRNTAKLQSEYFPIHVSSLGLQIRRHNQSKLSYLKAFDLNTGEELQDVKLKVFYDGAEINSYDNINQPLQLNRGVLVASYQDQLAILNISDRAADLNDFERISGPKFQHHKVYSWSTKDLYRPNETIELRALLRNHDGTLALEQPLHVTLLNPYQSKVKQQRIEATTHGFYEWKTKLSDSIGRWRVEFRTSENSPVIDTFYFQVQEFKPEKVSITGDVSNKVVIANDPNQLKLNVKYLFGANATGNTVVTSVRFSQQSKLWDKYSQYKVGLDDNQPGAYTTKRLSQQTIDQNGDAVIELPTDFGSHVAPVKASVDVEILENGNTLARKSFGYIILPNDDAFIALRPVNTSPEYGESIHFKAGIITPINQHLKEATVNLDIYSYRGNYSWHYIENQGWEKTKHENPWVYHDTVTQAVSGITDVKFNLDKGHFKVLASIDTDASDVNVNNTEYEFYNSWYDNDTGNRPGKLETKLDKSTYELNAKALLSIHIPQAGRVNIALTSQEVLWEKNLGLVEAGKQVIEIPVEHDRTDLFLTTSLMVATQGQPIQQSIDIVPLKINRDDNKLAVQLETKNPPRPNKPLTIDLNVSGLKGKGHAVISMVDKGVTNISGYTINNPFDHFYQQNGYPFSLKGNLYNQYGHLYSNFAEAKFGSDVGVSYRKQLNRSASQLLEVKSLSIISKLIELDENGQATVSLDIPDYNGEVDLVAIAFDDNNFGHYQKDLAIFAPLVAELYLPNNLVIGDKTSLSVVIHNMDDAQQAIDYQVQLPTGLTASLTTGSVTLNKGEKASNQINFDVTKTLLNRIDDVISIGLKASFVDPNLAAESQHRTWKVPVQHPTGVQQTRKQIEIVEPNQSFSLNTALFSGLEAPKQHLLISTKPELNLNVISGSLLQYPYGCTEQTTSKAWVWLLQHPQIKDKISNKLNDETIEDVLASATNIINKRRSYSGAYGLWSKHSEDPWITSYVADFLLTLKEQYPAIYKDAWNPKTNAKLKSYVKKADKTSKDLAVAAYAAYLLAKQGRIPRGELLLLHEEFESTADSNYTPAHMKMLATLSPQSSSEEKQINSLSQAYIASAFAHVGDVSKAIELMDSIKFVRSDKYIGDYGSAIRDRSLIASLMLELSKKYQNFNTLYANWFLDVYLQQHQQSYLSTQDKIALLKADNYQPTNTHFMISDDHSGKSFTGENNLNLVEQSHGELINNNDFPLYFDATVNGYSAVGLDKESNIYASTTKQYYYQDGSPYLGEAVSVGTRLYVVGTFSVSETIKQGMLVDKVPAGFEVDNPALSGTLNYNHIEPKDKDGIVIKHLNKFDLIEHRNDRFVIADHFYKNNRYAFIYSIKAQNSGLYQVPPMYIESMYQPQKHVISYPQFKQISIIDNAQ